LSLAVASFGSTASAADWTPPKELPPPPPPPLERRKAECQSRRGGKQAAGERSLGDCTDGCVHRDVLLLTRGKRLEAVCESLNSQAACQAERYN
jgi:hypothetical protein